MSLLLALLFGCTTPKGGDTDTQASCTPTPPFLAITTTDLTVGALAAYDLTTGCLADQIATTSGDPVVVAEQSRLFLLNRAGGDAVRELDITNLSVPLWEVALPGANAHDVMVVGDELWVSQYDKAEISIRSGVDGAESKTLDLSEFADADGLPEMDGLIRYEELGIVVLQRFERLPTGWEAQAGGLLILDLINAEVDVNMDIGPSPRLFPHPSVPGTVAILTGIYGEPDGALWIMDLVSGVLEEQITEEEAGVDFNSYAEVNGVGVLTGTDFALGGEASAWCFRNGALTLAARQQGWFTDVVAGPEFAWLSVRKDWEGVGNAGIQALDVAGCGLSGDLIPTTLEPYSLALVP